MKPVSIIIPCRNEEKYIENCINSFFEMDYPKHLLEIIIVDGMSSDKTQQIVMGLQSKNKNIKLILNPSIYTPHGMNLGIRSASNDYIMIASAHSIFNKNYLSELMLHMKELKCDAIGGVIITDVRNKTKKSLSICKVLSNKFGVGNSMFRIGTSFPIKVDIVPFGIYHKDLFETVGFYNENLIRNQDMEFSKRLIALNKEIYLIPEAICTYYARETFLALAKNNFGNGIWIPRTVYVTKNISSLSIRHFIPLAFMLTLIIPIPFSLIFHMSILIPLILLLIYLITISIISVTINTTETRFFNILWSFVVLHFSYGFGSLIGIFDFKKLVNRKKHE